MKSFVHQVEVIISSCSVCSCFSPAGLQLLWKCWRLWYSWWHLRNATEASPQALHLLSLFGFTSPFPPGPWHQIQSGKSSPTGMGTEVSRSCAKRLSGSARRGTEDRVSTEDSSAAPKALCPCQIALGAVPTETHSLSFEKWTIRTTLPFRTSPRYFLLETLILRLLLTGTLPEKSPLETNGDDFFLSWAIFSLLSEEKVFYNKVNKSLILLGYRSTSVYEQQSWVRSTPWIIT